MTPAPETTQVMILDELPFTIRARYREGVSVKHTGWYWTAIAEGHDELVEGTRRSLTAERAFENAVATLTARYR